MGVAPANVNGLKIISEPFVQRENCWNEISYSWYYLKKNYGVDTFFTVDFATRILPQYTAQGLYIQSAPYEQTLLISCVSGCAVIIIVDLREDSLSYLRYNRFILDDCPDRRSVYIPRGCAYGFVTLVDNTQLDFKADNYCKMEFEKTYNLLDPYYMIKVPYPGRDGEDILLSTLLSQGKLIMSVHDRCAPWLVDVATPKSPKIYETEEATELP